MPDTDSSTDGWQLADSAPEAYERYLVPDLFAPWAEDLVQRVALRPGERVLDVGCGTGIVARRAAAKVGEEGAVVGVDVNEGMLDVAREAAGDLRLPIEWRQADGTELPFEPDTFDVVFSQQMLQFVPDPGAALREMRRVLAPGGRLAVGVLRSLEFNPAYATLADALARHVGDEAAHMMRSPFPDWDGPALRALVEGAGFRTVVRTIEIGSMRYPSVDEFLRREAASSPLAAMLEAIDRDTRVELIADLQERLSMHVDDHGVVFPMQTDIIVASP